MTKQTLNIIHAVRDYRQWTVSNNMAEPRDDFDWYKETRHTTSHSGSPGT